MTGTLLEIICIATIAEALAIALFVVAVLVVGSAVGA